MNLALLPDRALAHNASVVRLERSWFVVATSRELRDRPIPARSRESPSSSSAMAREPRERSSIAARIETSRSPSAASSAASFNAAITAGASLETASADSFRSLTAPHAAKARNATAFATRELDGWIWVYSTPGEEPKTEPYRPRRLEKGYTTVRQVVEAKSTMHAALENALDVPHTQFLHRGLFRTKSRGIEIEAVVTRSADRVQAEYVGEPRPTGLVARILSPSGGTVTHFDRFILPSVAEVEYRIGDENHFLVSAAMTPVDDFFTRIFAAVSFRLRLIPGWLIAPFLKPLALEDFRARRGSLGASDREHPALRWRAVCVDGNRRSRPAHLAALEERRAGHERRGRRRARSRARNQGEASGLIAPPALEEGSTATGKQSTPESTVEAYFAAAKAKNRDAMLGLFTQEAQAKEREWKKSFTNAMFSQGIKIKESSVRGVSRDGDTTRISVKAVFTGPDGKDDGEGMHFVMLRQAGKWWIIELD